MSLRSDTKAVPFYFLFFSSEKSVFITARFFFSYSSRCQWEKQERGEENAFLRKPWEKHSKESSRKIPRKFGKSWEMTKLKIEAILISLHYPSHFLCCWMQGMEIWVKTFLITWLIVSQRREHSRVKKSWKILEGKKIINSRSRNFSSPFLHQS